MKQLYIKDNIKYLLSKGLKVDKSIIENVNDNKLPLLDDLIKFSNETGISINEFLFVKIENQESLS